MRIAVVGTGYVGLVAGTCFAESGNNVVCIDIDEEKVAGLRAGRVPIYEPGLEELLRRNMHDGRLSFTTSYEEGIDRAQVVFIAVGTPPGENGRADLQYVLAATESIARNMTGYTVIVDKSTVPVGTAAKVAERVRQHTEHPFDVVSNPEFLKEGAAIDDFLKPDRVVIGSSSARASEIMDELYAPFVRTGNPILHTDVPSAELTKYAANAMLATRISFMNEIANLCDEVGADIDDVRKGIGTDARIGMRFLFAGCGYGGSCFPKDVQAIIKTADGLGYDFRILKAVESVNESQKRRLFDLVEAYYEDGIAGKRFAVWGLAFKPNTDDMREAPALVVIEALLAAGATVTAYDPEAMAESKRHYFGDRIDYAEHPMEALEGAHGLVVVTEWNEFRRPDFEAVKAALERPAVFDGRNIYSRAVMERLGFDYFGMGR
ncbi:MAG: UDP-glucose/GDP-mannose dehydrogenase family protein [Planctomycetota bacterium]|jgi:UDPglucose 6-dehydrogenase|nr:UDP-glucose/GDP-mannose dehydrogenase family protein [Planctomycetota bacterium]MDP6761333.1 UDP-glucose/GDP-mannose dehydrogenase family protein [Planctomycetota bacterium]MDP6991044.1 UDP-glucose/GDP-mannose dehydrogenase family protein [Planctomycetota bacterium]